MHKRIDNPPATDWLCVTLCLTDNASPSHSAFCGSYINLIKWCSKDQYQRLYKVRTDK